MRSAITCACTRTHANPLKCKIYGSRFFSLYSYIVLLKFYKTNIKFSQHTYTSYLRLALFLFLSYYTIFYFKQLFYYTIQILIQCLHYLLYQEKTSILPL